ncbi:hypothetical protein C5167_009465 [Papaver somniferum]|uniref:Uncharacterized protein n=1 Tax=Papaver somniferum TaxID=3469 RepID=A0A4Y7K1D5_PAPSO|nr:hypothetical protein C5167_009465 [Papaver somniferum]
MLGTPCIIYSTIRHLIGFAALIFELDDELKLKNMIDISDVLPWRFPCKQLFDSIKYWIRNLDSSGVVLGDLGFGRLFNIFIICWYPRVNLILTAKFMPKSAGLCYA